MTDKKKKGLRAYALDALRGIAILLMILSGSVPFQNRFAITDVTIENIQSEDNVPQRVIDSLKPLKGVEFGKYALKSTLQKKLTKSDFEKYQFVIYKHTPVDDISLPGWMYHAQVHPPANFFNPKRPGITWVDLVFPFFLFAMGTAFPFAISRRMQRGEPKWKLVLQTIKRGLILAWFAIYLWHIKPWAISSSPDTGTYLFSILGFLLLFPMYLRFPKQWNLSAKVKGLIRFAGYAFGVILILNLYYPENGLEPGFSGIIDWLHSIVRKSDIIILVLANVAVFGTIIWIYTKDNILLRLGILGILLALRLTAGVPGSWNQWLWSATPFGWLYQMEFLKYLFIVIPGTVIGDYILKWMNNPAAVNESITPKGNSRMLSILSLMIVFIMFNLIGLYARYLVTTLLVNIVLCAAGFIFLRNAESPTEKLLKTLFQWGAYWLILGLCFEAFEGGIKKDHATFSYFFITTGLAIFTYIGLSVVIDYYKMPRSCKLLIQNGQNPMVAYIIGATFITPVLVLTSLNEVLNYLLITPWLGFIKGVIFTTFVALLTALFTKYKLFWKT